MKCPNCDSVGAKDRETYYSCGCCGYEWSEGEGVSDEDQLMG